MDIELKDAIRAALGGTLCAAAIAIAAPAAADVTVDPAPPPAKAATPAPAAPVARAAPASPATPAPAATPAARAAPAIAGSGYPETLRGGQQALDAGDAASAAWIFSRVAKSGGRDAEAANYWQAYSELRAGRAGE